MSFRPAEFGVSELHVLDHKTNVCRQQNAMDDEN
jgi:hypothetical protein